MIEVAGSTEEIESTGLAIITLSRIVDFRLSKHQDLCTESVPLDLCPVCFEERLLTCRRR